MLPDFPHIKTDFRKKVLVPYINKRVNEFLGVLSTIRAIPQFEGNRHTIIREDGTQDKIKYKSIAAEINYHKALHNIEALAPKDIFQELNGLAYRISGQKLNIIMEKMNQTVTKTGNIVNIKGKKLKVSDYLKLLEKIAIDFDDNDEPILPQIFTTQQESYDNFIEVMKKIKSSSTYQRKFNNIIALKREEFRVREDNRKLD